MEKNPAKAKQHPEAELSKNIHILKNVQKKNKCVCFNKII